ncbi:DUF998 domain-containing protein [Nonomuraea angiospora]|uniref:Membrane protein n=1 Tax=Nonomuraea angiospora TaxID=46172 RepID=A0ABR9LXZ1_9ACTN|nr:DUF998 domain-containing protein [Nonomuraea angiospora]MBE1585514.1 putative membrane protein [Nonomuraea angiospora]
MRTLTPAGPAPIAGPGDPTPRRLLLCGVVAGPLFVVAFLVQGALRPHYDPLRHPVSSLALGPGGWVQAVTFVVAGLLTLAFAAGLRRALRRVWGPVLVGVWGGGLVGAGLFTTDPVSGYPPGTPGLLPEYGSTHAALHDYLSLAGFVALIAACLVFAVGFARKRELGWAAYSAASGAGFTVAMALATIAFSQAPALVAHGGLYQRVAITIGWAWLTLLALRTLRRRPAGRRTAAGRPRRPS